MPTSLAGWLDYQQRIHPREIALGLDRVREVWGRMGSPVPASLVITVGGTNGKGSTVAFLEAMLAAAGKRVGAYTSPHLLRYNERVRVTGCDAEDDALIDAFTRIETARGELPLTYFEYGTLAALWIFSRANLDVAILEVGLGGRLDAVNIIDADAAIVTTVDLDHQDWLGNDRGSIGREKAGIFRAGHIAVVGDRDPPRTLTEYARRIGAQIRLAGRDFLGDSRSEGWRWTGWREPGSGGSAPCLDLPLPALAAPCQIDNAATAIATLYALRARIGWNPKAITTGVANARVGARLQRFAGEPELIIDVAHNPQAAGVLAEWLRNSSAGGRTLAVFGALGDKDVNGVVSVLAADIDAWILAGLDKDSPRGLNASVLSERLSSLLADTGSTLHANVGEGLFAAFAAAQPGDRVIAFGSFLVAAAALEFAQDRGLAAG